MTMRRLSSLRVELPLRRIVGIAFLTGWIGLYAQPLTGTHYITGTSAFDASGGQFATIQEAFDSLMARGVGANGVIFRVQDSWVGSPTGQDAEPNTIQLSTYDGAASDAPVTLTFEDLTSPVYFAKAPAQFIFRFTGSVKYFTLDGAGNLILESTTTGGTSTGLIGFVSSSSLDLDIDAITIQNVVMRGSGRDNTFVGVYIGDAWWQLGGSVTPGSNIGANEGITIQGCTIESVSRPILVAGIRANTRNIRVLQNTLGNPTNPIAWAADNNIGAVHLRGVQNPIVQGCVIHGAANFYNFSIHSVAGIRLDSCENFTITQNWVYNIEYFGPPSPPRGYGNYGIYIALPSTFIGSSVNNVVSHNMLAGLVADGDIRYDFPEHIPAGILVSTTSGSISDAKLALIHNSIHLFGSGDFGLPFISHNGSSAGIAIGSSVQGGVKIHGNLIQNTFDAFVNDTAYGLVIATGSPSTAGFDIDYNQYYLGGSAFRKVYARVGTNVFPIFSDWQGSNIPNIPSPDANGLVHEPGPVPFVSNTDLHLNPTEQSSAINAGNPAYNGAVDFDGQERPIGGGGGDPGTAPDVGADELAGTPILCPSSLQAPEIVVSPPLVGSYYLWGQQVEIDTTGANSPTPSGTLNLIYSLDGGQTWTVGPSVSSFPITITLPPLSPPTYTGTLQIAVRASAPVLCGLTADTSNIVFLDLSDRPGNRAANAIPITLDSPVSGIWTATISDSTDGLATSDEYNFSTGAPWWSPSRDLFFVLRLPECLDSLVLNTCSGNTNFNTRIHFINASTNDIITSDDQGNICTSAGSLVSPSLLSKMVVLGLPNALRVTQTSVNDIGFEPFSSSKVVRDTALLVRGDTIYIVVEGSFYEQGKFELTITGYKMPRPGSISVSGAPDSPVCINSSPITLTATSGATTYIWKVNGTPQASANTATFNFSPTSEGTFNVTATAVYNPNNDPSCPTSSDSVTSQPVTITVEDIARAQIANASNNVVSGQTLSITAGSTVTLNVSSPQTSGNTYTWKLYNSFPPLNTPPTSTGTDNTFPINNISAGSYTVILEAVRGTGACGTTRDTVYLNVTTGLRTDAGTFSIFPNPNTGAFTIAAPAMDTYRVQVLDVAGHLVAEDAFTGSTHQIRVSLPAGIYQVRLIAGEKVQVGRLIITE
jgi:hypothetical protein